VRSEKEVCHSRFFSTLSHLEASGDANDLAFPSAQSVRVKGHDFTLDRVFDNAQQDEVFRQVQPSIEDVLNGFNSTIFAYGQTGSGKSFTMFGDVRSEKQRGIIPRACHFIFSHIAEDESGTEWQIKSSFLEIYMENVKDLLSSDKSSLKVRETPARGVWVEGLTEEFVTSEAEVLDLLARGEKQRSTSATGMNETSSRSHSLFVLTVTQRLKDGSTRTGKLNLGDLAGSEKVGKTGATGTTLDEAKKINQSLSALGNCINALTKEGDRGHVPYRDSKLTFILRESLGGNTKTTLIVACSPHVFNVEETVSTLRFAQRAKNITNSVSVNQKRSVEELELIVKALTDEIAALKKKLGMPPGAGRDAVALPSSALSEGALKNNDEQAEQLLVLQYELSGVRKELADVKQEVAAAKLQDEAFAAERRKWEYDSEQLKLQVESESSLAAASAERAGKVQLEKEALVKSVAELEAKLEQATQREQQQVRSAAEQLGARTEKLVAAEDKLGREQARATELAAQFAQMKEAHDRAAAANKVLEQQVRDMEMGQRERDLVEASLRSELKDLQTGSTTRNDELSELRAKLLQNAKAANVAETTIASLTAALAAKTAEREALAKELEQARIREEAGAALREQQANDFRQQMQLKVREQTSRDAMHEEVLFRETAQAKKLLLLRDQDVRHLTEKLEAARNDLDDQQSKYLVHLKQQEQRNKRIHALEEELASRNAQIKELKVGLRFVRFVLFSFLTFLRMTWKRLCSSTLTTRRGFRRSWPRLRRSTSRRRSVAKP
jgi:kinesin family protein 5